MSGSYGDVAVFGPLLTCEFSVLCVLAFCVFSVVRLGLLCVECSPVSRRSTVVLDLVVAPIIAPIAQRKTLLMIVACIVGVSLRSQHSFPSLVSCPSPLRLYRLSSLT